MRSVALQEFAAQTLPLSVKVNENFPDSPLSQKSGEAVSDDSTVEQRSVDAIVFDSLRRNLRTMMTASQYVVTNSPSFIIYGASVPPKEKFIYNSGTPVNLEASGAPFVGSKPYNLPYLPEATSLLTSVGSAAGEAGMLPNLARPQSLIPAGWLNNDTMDPQTA